MIERKFIETNIRDLEIIDYIKKQIPNSGYSRTEIEKTPLGMRVVIFTSKPGLVVGRKGVNIVKIQKYLQDIFKLKNPQVEVQEVETPDLDAQINAESIASYLEKMGVSRFKAIGHKHLTKIMEAGAIGVEILIGGKVPGSRAKTWRFYAGYLPKCGSVSNEVQEAKVQAMTRPGTVGVTVRILRPGVRLPDEVIFKDLEKDKQEKVEEFKEEAPEKKEEPKKEEKKEKRKVKGKKKGIEEVKKAVENLKEESKK